MRQQPGAGGRTPSDLPLVALSQAEIERLERQYPQIEDILPLSPLQEGLLFHALYDAQAPDVYTVQLVLDSGGRARQRRRCARRRRRCWSVMRACAPAFAHETLSRPVQVIVPTVDAALAQHRSVVAGRGGARGAAGRHCWPQDRAERFDLAAPPLLRFTLIRLAADGIGWCSPTITS